MRKTSRVWREGENNYPKGYIIRARCPDCGAVAVLCGGCSKCRRCCVLSKWYQLV